LRRSYTKDFLLKFRDVCHNLPELFECPEELRSGPMPAHGGGGSGMGGRYGGADMLQRQGSRGPTHCPSPPKLA
jgi:hypothetical protein